MVSSLNRSSTTINTEFRKRAGGWGGAQKHEASTGREGRVHIHCWMFSGSWLAGICSVKRAKLKIYYTFDLLLHTVDKQASCVLMLNSTSSFTN